MKYYNLVFNSQKRNIIVISIKLITSKFYFKTRFVIKILQQLICAGAIASTFVKTTESQNMAVEVITHHFTLLIIVKYYC
jgi:hypothetical protein